MAALVPRPGSSDAVIATLHVAASRQEARRNGWTRYAGVQCPYGHDGIRRTSNGKCLGCAKQWFADRPEQRKSYYRTSWRNHHEQNKEKSRVRQRANYARDRAPFLVHIRNRRAAKQQAQGSYTDADLCEIMEQQGLSCYCGVSFLTVEPTVDHVIPLSRGGSNWPDNLQLLCSPCNTSKGVKTHEEWVAWFSR